MTPPTIARLWQLVDAVCTPSVDVEEKGDAGGVRECCAHTPIEIGGCSGLMRT